MDKKNNSFADDWMDSMKTWLLTFMTADYRNANWLETHKNEKSPPPPTNSPSFFKSADLKNK